jgi:hypothetical protein
MEDVMLGSKRTIPFWRQRRRLLTLERALLPERADRGKGPMTVQAVAQARARERIVAEAKRKGRFWER